MNIYALSFPSLDMHYIVATMYIPYSLVNKRMRLSLSLARKYAPIR